MNSEILDGLPAADYHRRPELSASGMKILAKKPPAKFQHWLNSGEEHKREFDIGTAAHSLILEDDAANIRTLDYPNYKTKEAQIAKAKAYEDGVVPLLPFELSMVKAMRDSVMAYPLARVALAGGIPERTFIWQHATGVGMRARFDSHNQTSKIGPIIADVKTVTTADPDEFRKMAWNLGYHQQTANYLDGASEATGLEHEFVFILVEKEPPYLVNVVQIDADFIDAGRQLNDKAVRIFAECSLTGEWPGYSVSEPLAMPGWASYQLEDLLK